MKELPSVLWTHRTTVRKSTGETPFALAYGVETVIPLEVGIPTTRTTDFAVETNEDNLRKDLDLLKEKWDLIVVRLALYQQWIKREHEKKKSNQGYFELGTWFWERLWPTRESQMKESSDRIGKDLTKWYLRQGLVPLGWKVWIGSLFPDHGTSIIWESISFEKYKLKYDICLVMITFVFEFSGSNKITTFRGVS